MEKLARLSEALMRVPGPKMSRFLKDTIAWDERLIIIRGPRGVGKTTLMLQRLRELKLSTSEAMYFTLDDVYFGQVHLRDLAQTFAEGGGRYLFIDEVHRYPHESWIREIKNIYDLMPSLSMVISGSSVLHLNAAKADLSRRMARYDLPGLSFREYINITTGRNLPTVTFAEIVADPGAAAASLLTDGVRPLDHFGDYLRFGYYPIFLGNKDLFINRINDVISTVIEVDLPYADRFSSDNSRVLSRLLGAIATAVPFKPNISKLAERLGIDRRSVTRYLYLLQEAEILRLLPADATGVGSLQKPEKVYFDNTNLLYALNPQGINAVGAVRETFFASQLSQLPRRGLTPPRLVAGKQVDFTYHTMHATYHFEVGGPNKTRKQLKGLEGAYVVADGIEIGSAGRIPLWLFGFLY